MATYIATTAFIPTFLDDNGVPLNGGTLESYIAGTTTPTPTFTGEAGVSAGNIITLNARGEPETSGNTHQVWIDSAIKYDFVLKTAAGVIINSPEDIASPLVGSVASTLNIASAKALTTLTDGQAIYIRGYTTAGDGGGGMYVYDASSAATANDGTVLALDTLAGRLLHSETTLITVKTFGAVGDGVTDSTTALQNAINNLSPGDALNTGDSSDIYIFSNLTLITDIVWAGQGTLKGTVSGIKPTKAALIAAGNAAAREALIDAYYTSTITTAVTNVTSGTLSLADCVVKGPAIQFYAKGRVELSDVGFYGISLATEAGHITSDAGALIIDSPADGVFFQNSGTMRLSSCVVLYSALRGAHIQFDGMLYANSGTFDHNGGEGAFLNAGGVLYGASGFFSNNGGSGLLALYGGSLNIQAATSDANAGSGLVVESNSAAYAQDTIITNNGSTGIDTSYDGVVQAVGSTITGNTGNAVRIRSGGVVNVLEATIDRTNNGGIAPMLWVQGRGVIYSEDDTGVGKTALNADDFKPVHNEMNGLAWIGDWTDPDDTGKRSRYYAYSTQNSAQVIASGVITASNGWISVDTEALAATDNLNTINGGQNLQRIILTAASSTRTVVVKHGTGNIYLNAAADFSLDHNRDTIELIQQNGVYVELSRSNNT